MGRIIVQYLVRGAYYAHVGSGTASPKNWKMQGSNNASDWTDLDTVTNETAWGDREERVFTMDDTGEYQYYRLNCTLNNGNTHYVCLSEIELREELGGANVCTALTSNSAPEPYTADQSSALAGVEAYKAWSAYDQNDADPGQWCSAAVPSVETPQWCYYNFATDEPPAAVIQGPRLVSAKSIFHKLGDNAGANKYVLQDSDDVEVFSVDSDGHIVAPTDDLDPATKKYVDDNEFSLTADCVKDTHIDWGSGAGQVDADDIGDGSTNAIPTLTQEGNWDTHISATNPHSKHVDTEGNETIAGIKTFSSFPVTPSSAPTSDYEVGNKKYVDDTASAGAPADGWVAAGETWTYASADDPTYTFTIASFDATTKYSAGMRVKLTQTTAKYFIITKVVFDDPGSTITVYGGTDYDLADAAITSPCYSMLKAPLGFPLDPDVWTVEVADTTQRDQASPGNATWYNMGSTTIDIPLGIWDVSYQVTAQFNGTDAIASGGYTTLSKASNTEDDSEFTCWTYGRGYDTGAGNYKIVGTSVQRNKTLNLSAKDTYYLNAMTSYNGTSITFQNDNCTCVIKARCAYL